MKPVLKAGALVAGVLALSMTGSVSAMADPANPTDYRTYAAVGSDTIQDVWNGLGNGYTKGATTYPAVTGEVASWNAFPAGNITTKLNGPAFTRPAGSGEGVKALSASVDPANHIYSGTSIANQVDFSRSSSGAAKDGADLTYLPFARDAVSVVVKSSATGTVDVTTQQLADIYNCVANTVTVGTTVVTVNPKLPQAGSGTRAFFLKAAGVTTPGACVGTVGPENDGGQLTTAGDIIPFSAAQWISQQNGVVTNTVGATDLKIASVNSQDPSIGTAPSLTPGALYGSTTSEPATSVGTFARDTYNVVPTAQYTSATTLVTSTLTSKIQSPTGIRTLKDFGFKDLSYTGDPTVKGTAPLASHQSLYKH